MVLFSKYFKPKKGGNSLLDIGGTGNKANFLKHKGFEVTVVDIVTLHDAWNKHEVSGIVGDFLDVNFEENFDFIIDIGCFHHQSLLVREEYLKKVRKTLAFGGVFL